MHMINEIQMSLFYTSLIDINHSTMTSALPQAEAQV